MRLKVQCLLEPVKMSDISIKLFLEYNRSLAMLILGNKDFGNSKVKSSYESKQILDDYEPGVELLRPESAILEEL